MELDKIILGSIMVDPDIAEEAFSRLSLEDFNSDMQKLYASLEGLWSLSGAIDVVEACERYPELKGPLLASVAALESECIRPTKERVIEWIKLLKEKNALEKFQALAFKAVDALTTYEDLTNIYNQMGEAMSTEITHDEFKELGDLVDDYIRNLDVKPVYIKTGIGALDNKLHIVAGNLILIGGRPSAGKTALSLQIAVEMAKQNKRVCYFSLETSAETLTQRIIANRVCANLEDVKQKKVPIYQLDYLADLKNLPLFIRSASGKSVAWIKTQAKRMKADAIFVDYVGLIRPEKRAGRYEEVTEISMALHELAQISGMIVVGLVQLKRNESHADPTLADLKDSGQLEQDADAAILLGGTEHPFILAKNKEGRVGALNVCFNKDTQRFMEQVGYYDENE